MNDTPSSNVVVVRIARLYERLGASSAAHAVASRVYSAWDAPTRHYHDVRHLTECLHEVDRQPLSADRDRVELALVYHDAIYEPGTTDSEARSAALLLSDASVLGLPESAAQEAAALVRATQHGVAPCTSDSEALMIDIDLAILGSETSRFMEFELGVEREYAAIPTQLFRAGRARFLSRLLEAPIYRTLAYRDRLEARARENISALLGGERYRDQDRP